MLEEQAPIKREAEHADEQEEEVRVIRGEDDPFSLAAAHDGPGKVRRHDRPSPKTSP